MNDMLIRELKRFFIVLIASISYSVGLFYFLNVAKVYASGVTGFAQLFFDLFKLDTYFLGILVFILNVPFLVLSWFKLSKKFTYYTIFSVIVQSLVLIFLPESINEHIQLEIITYTIMGSILTAFGMAIALKVGASTGGVDVLAQYLALNKGISVGIFTMFTNFVISLLGGIINSALSVTIYSLLRIILSSVIVDKIHTAYNFIRLDIVTNKGNELSEVLIKHTNHSTTKIEATGFYSKMEKEVLVLVISSYELNICKFLIKKHDPTAFVTIMPVKGILGFFNKKTID